MRYNWVKCWLMPELFCLCGWCDIYVHHESSAKLTHRIGLTVNSSWGEQRVQRSQRLATSWRRRCSLARNWAQPSHSQHFLFPRCARDVPNDALDFTSNYVMVSLRLPTNQFVQYQSNVQPNRMIKLHFHSETFPTLQSDSSLLKGSVTVSDSHWIGVNCVGAQKVFLEVLGFYSPPFHFLASQVQKNVLEKNLAPSTNQMRYARSEIRFLGNLAFKLHILFALYGETNSELSRWNNNNRAMDALDGISFLLPYLKQNVQCTGQLWTAHTLQSNYHANKF